MINPWVLLIVGAVWIASVGTAFWKGRNFEAGVQAKAHAQQLAAALQQAQDNALIDMQAAADVERQKATGKVIYRTITEQVNVEVEKPVYRDCVLPDDGVRLWNDANAGRISKAAAAGKPDPALPGLATTPIDQLGLRPPQPR